MKNDELILNNIPLIYKAIKDMHLYWDTEDEFQEHYDNGLLGLIKGAKAYNSDISKPSTYLYRCIKHEICKGLYFKQCYNKKANYETISLNQKVLDDEDSNELIDFLLSDIDIEEQMLEKSKIDELHDAINKLKKNQKKMAIMYYTKEMTMDNIAEQLNCSKSNVRLTLERAKLNIKNSLINKEKPKEKSIEEMFLERM